jgi:hypothetical protein
VPLCLQLPVHVGPAVFNWVLIRGIPQPVQHCKFFLHLLQPVHNQLALVTWRAPSLLTELVVLRILRKEQSALRKIAVRRGSGLESAGRTDNTQD